MSSMLRKGRLGQPRTQARGYENIWGKNAGSVQAAQKPPVRRNILTERGKKETWRLDWEEDGRWVEWRLDMDEQDPADRERVNEEWSQFREQRGRDSSKLVSACMS